MTMPASLTEGASKSQVIPPSPASTVGCQEETTPPRQVGMLRSGGYSGLWSATFVPGETSAESVSMMTASTPERTRTSYGLMPS